MISEGIAIIYDLSVCYPNLYYAGPGVCVDLIRRCSRPAMESGLPESVFELTTNIWYLFTVRLQQQHTLDSLRQESL